MEDRYSICTLYNSYLQPRPTALCYVNEAETDPTRQDKTMDKKWLQRVVYAYVRAAIRKRDVGLSQPKLIPAPVVLSHQKTFSALMKFFGWAAKHPVIILHRCWLKKFCPVEKETTKVNCWRITQNFVDEVTKYKREKSHALQNCVYRSKQQVSEDCDLMLIGPAAVRVGICGCFAVGLNSENEEGATTNRAPRKWVTISHIVEKRIRQFGLTLKHPGQPNDSGLFVLSFTLSVCPLGL